jgi:threonine dehydrogenase-like Zn-dependent dehydrogenase
MRAVIRRGGRLVLDSIAEPEPDKGQVLVKTLACGICGSDLHALHHAPRMAEMAKKAGNVFTMDPARDVVFGHEFCAEVLDYGPQTERRFKPGTRVVSVPNLISPTGIETVGYSNRYPGGYAERMVLSEPLLLPVPNGLPTDHAALTEPFAVGAHAVASASLGDGDTAALVIGCGPVGLAVIAALKARGYGPVIAADYSAMRRKLAETYGADEVVDPTIASPHACWSRMGIPASLRDWRIRVAGGERLKRGIIFECVGVPGVLHGLMEAAPPTAQIVVVGVCMETDKIEPYLGITKEIELRFVLGYSREEFARTLADIAEGRIDAAPIITGTVGLDGVAQAFEDLGRPERHAKIVVEPGRA